MSPVQHHLSHPIARQLSNAVIERRYRTPLSNAVIERRTSIEHPPISNAANRTPGTIEICDISPSLRPKTLEAKKALVTGQV